MAYTWKDGDTITAAGLNASQITFVNDDVTTGADTNLPEGALTLDNKGDLYASQSGKQALLVSLNAAGVKGDPGADGKDGAAGKDGANGKDGLSMKALALTADSTGKLTGGTVTLTDDSTVPVTVTAEPAK